MNHQPELGQWAFSTTPFLEHPVSELALAALRAINDEIERVMWNLAQDDLYRGPGSNSGLEAFETDIFVMRPYCWCDGEKHPDGCPPNFQWRDVQITWYKHLSRGLSANQVLSPDVVAEMLVECLAAVRGMDVKY